MGQSRAYCSGISGEPSALICETLKFKEALINNSVKVEVQISNLEEKEVNEEVVEEIQEKLGEIKESYQR